VKHMLDLSALVDVYNAEMGTNLNEEEWLEMNGPAPVITREPWTDPLTIRERMAVKRSLFSYDVRRFFRDGIWQWMAHKLPERVIYFAMMRGYAAVWSHVGTITPDLIDFDMAMKYWGRKTGLVPVPPEEEEGA
jgi:hypothetical protein